ncbi:hypothetical protein ACH6CV_01445 [Bacillota bacterium Meth-B3]
MALILAPGVVSLAQAGQAAPRGTVWIPDSAIATDAAGGISSYEGTCGAFGAGTAPAWHEHEVSFA